MNKKALSPLIATIILVVFSLIVGTLTMNWGKSYVEKISLEEEKPAISGTIVINADSIDTPLKELQVEYLTGKITLQQYLAREESLK